MRRLPPELTRLIKSKVASGQHSSASEVVREALERMAEDDRKTLAGLDRDIAVGMADSKAGRMKSGRVVMKLIRTRLSRSAKARRTR